MEADNKQFGSLTFRAPYEFVEETKRMAGDKPISQYLREAVREKNEREMAERIRFLSRRLAQESAEIAEEFDDAAGDGL
ncbi:antitoxin of toxin-antitoxin stability system [Lacisediminimonas profundi]|uniref:antitoxin of toxin-antitoxin stability system n=1 Tax=Lacisediminimonas profundi TaxID=2603856 RepID=UPI00124B0F5D|nr:antitoxin of toxin-antitoxin stability system [Lacisediminimonas profundi]